MPVKYKDLSKTIDDSTGQLLIYGRCAESGRNVLLCFYSINKGLECLYNLKNSLSEPQVGIIRRWIADFNPKYSIQL